MAHVAKYAAAACGGMCAHYDRTPELERGYRRDNIDPERTRENYNLAPDREGGQVAFINERIASLGLKRAPRKDAVRMCDCVLTMPKTLDPSRSREFFEQGYSFLSSRYGAENVVSAYVHMDEAQPHMHFAWVPVTEDGRLSAKDVVTRRDLRTLHGDMQKSLEKAMGCRVDVLLDPENQGEKQLSHLDQREYIAAKDRLECLRQREVELGEEIEQLQPAAVTLAESVGTLVKTRGDGSREQQLAAENQQLRERVGQLERDCAAARGRIEQLRDAMPGLRQQVLGAVERLEQLVERVTQRLQDRGVISDRFSRSTQEIARKVGVRVMDAFSYDMWEATEAAHAINRSRRRGFDPPSHVHRRGR